MLLPLLVLLAPLAACGDLPQPFRGRPGQQAAQLAQPPAVRIAVPRPTQALLPDDGAEALAEALADALLAAEVPAAATDPLPLDWRLAVQARREGQGVVPRFALTDADGTPLGSVTGPPVPARAWAEGQAEALRAAAREAAPGLARIVARVEAARKATDPAALAGGPPRLRFIPVRGAPGDGNAALTARMRAFLTNRGFLVQEEGEGAAYAVEGVVAVVRGATPAVQRVEVQWIVSRRDGFELGRVLQLNEVPRGSLDGLWGDVAYVVADEASGGVRDVIRNAGGVPVPPAQEQAAAAPPARAGGGGGSQAAPAAAPDAGPAGGPAGGARDAAPPTGAR